MRMTAQQFRDWPHRAITLLGMSGVGKTTLANKLPKSRWFHYSGDYRIGTKYLAEPILDNIKKKAMEVDFLSDLLRSDSIYIASNITVHNLEPVATFLGKIGRADEGGLTIKDFKNRQRLHKEAETGAMKDVAEFIHKAYDIYGYAHFLNDAGGSLCELDDPKALQVLEDNTLLLYLRADTVMEETLLQRAIDDPKPMYYPDAFLDPHLATYMRERKISDADQIVPNDFVRWVFPQLLAYRRPKYQALADKYGYTVDARAIEAVKDEAEFLDLVAALLD